MESEYEKKRDFSRTDEPRMSGGRPSGDDPIFVIQKHDAGNLHYDFRLEIDGVLKSWSVPKGPSTDTRERRLAIPTEDHPLSYAEFEGEIPEGEYGGGTVMVWDTGTFSNLKRDHQGRRIPLPECYIRGTVEVYLNGEKISGGYALIRIEGKKLGGNWLLIKMKDDAADARRNPTSTQNRSVLSGRTMKEIAAGQKSGTQSHGTDR